MMLRRTLLLFGFPAEESAALVAACREAGFAALPVPEEKWGLTLSGILSGAAAPETSPESLSEPLIVFHGLEDSALDAALALLRSRGIRALKAVTTPTNLRWTPAALQRQLSAERKVIRKGKKKH